jgi:hypothetical protein
MLSSSPVKEMRTTMKEQRKISDKLIVMMVATDREGRADTKDACLLTLPGTSAKI